LKFTKFFWFCFIISLQFGIPIRGTAQNGSIQIGKQKIALNEYFTISIQIQNDRLKQYSEFPEIEGFIKRGTSSSTTTNFVNGRMSSTQSITQNYQATRQGVFKIPSFSMKINGESYSFEGGTVEVGEPIQRSTRRRRDPFDNFFKRDANPTEFVDVEADAFLALSVDKEEVYVGEGFTATLAFYVSETNRAEMRFFDLANQITEIVKTVKPENCWEENFTIDQIVGDPVTINNKGYTRYKIYQTAYYPLNIGTIQFPSIGLKMIKYNVAKNPSFFGRNRQEDYETFYSRTKNVKVVDLPPHPLKNQVAVGNYRLEESISAQAIQTGQSFNYEFDIVGEGNISGIDAPQPIPNRIFDFYSPNIKQNINRSNGRVRGIKSYDYYGIPNEPGTYDLGDYFSWIFFNPTKEEYDTLRSEIILEISGESRRNLNIASNDLGDFYNTIDSADNTIYSLSGNHWLTLLVNALLGITLILVIYFLIKKPVSS
jgi:hypothetical protein